MNSRELHRGKRKDTGEWIEGFLFLGFEKAYICPKPTAMYYYEGALCLGGFIEVYPFTVGQSTGTTDVNAKIIFEGDVVLAKRIIDGSDWRGIIVFWNGCFAIKGYNGNVPAIDLFKDIEIIGNIHDDYDPQQGRE